MYVLYTTDDDHAPVIRSHILWARARGYPCWWNRLKECPEGKASSLAYLLGTVLSRIAHIVPGRRHPATGECYLADYISIAVELDNENENENENKTKQKRVIPSPSLHQRKEKNKEEENKNKNRNDQLRTHPSRPPSRQSPPNHAPLRRPQRPPHPTTLHVPRQNPLQPSLRPRPRFHARHDRHSPSTTRTRRSTILEHLHPLPPIRRRKFLSPGIQRHGT